MGEVCQALTVGCGEQVLVVSGLRLRAVSDHHSETITTALARRLERRDAVSTVVFAGDNFELVEEPNNSPGRALRAHPRLELALARFVAVEGRRLVVLGGRHDRGATTDERARSELQRLGAIVADRCRLTVETGTGTRRLLLAGGLGAERDSSDAASDRFYDRLRKRAWVPPAGALAVLAGGLILHAMRSPGALHPASWWAIAYLCCSALSVLVISAVLVVWRTEHVEHPGPGADDTNGAARASAAAAVGVDGCIFTGASDGELVDLGDRWYANPGACRRRTTSRPTRFGLTPVVGGSDCSTWLELEAGAELHVRWVAGRRDDRPANWLGRLVAGRDHDVSPVPTVVAELHPGVVWPTPTDAARDDDSTRRRAALVVALAGTINIASALTPEWRGRRWLLRQVLPVDVPPLAAGVVAAAGVALVLVALGLRRGRRPAWQLATVLLGVSAAGHLVKGVDIEEAAIAALAATWLLLHRRAFAASLTRPPRRLAVGIAALLAAVAAIGTATIEASTGQGWGHSALIVLGRMIGIPADRLPRREYLLAAALPLVTTGATATLAWMALRARRPPPDDDVTAARTWEIVRRHGGGTLDYFALRDDKHHFIVEDTVVAYTVANGAVVVSPDPIGPSDQRVRAWSAFRAFAADGGWQVAILGAGEAWLPVYHAGGMTSMYIGDEAVVDVTTFELSGGRHKSLRQAINRIAGAGYTLAIHRGDAVPPALVDGLRGLSTMSRRGTTERGYSMTLSRLFDPRDSEVLVVAALAPDGHAAAFCQFVPARDIGGYSLDVVRRDNSTPSRHPNGLIEFLLAGTIDHLRNCGDRGLGLHFATMRALIAGDAGERVWQRGVSRLMSSLSDDMQIESLWRFNAKFDPTWLPRYIVIDRPRSSLRTAVAIAHLESLWELPVVGRLMRPSADAIAG